MTHHRTKPFIAIIYFFMFILIGCIDPIAPEYNFVDGLIIVEGLASSSPGTSYVTINQTSSEFGIYRNVFQEGANVTLKNLKSGEIVVLSEQPNTYVPPDDFFVSVGDSWELNITLTDGSQYKSFPETVIEPVPISNIDATYEKELIFREASGKFVPGHSISISFDDPGNEKNYYFWRFRSFEKLKLCVVCQNSIFRDGACIPNPSGYAVPPYFTYGCETDCWQIRYNESIEIFDDEFTNGTTIDQLPVGDVLLYGNGNILVTLEQLSLSFDAYQYYKRLKDVVDNNGNFNAPPPSAVVGNIYNPDDDNEVILGRFTATSISIASIFIDRSTIRDNEIEPIPDLVLESSPPFDPNVTTAPCYEGRFRTGIQPEGWIEN